MMTIVIIAALVGYEHKQHQATARETDFVEGENIIA